MLIVAVASSLPTSAAIRSARTDLGRPARVLDSQRVRFGRGRFRGTAPGEQTGGAEQGEELSPGRVGDLGESGCGHDGLLRRVLTAGDDRVADQRRCGSRAGPDSDLDLLVVLDRADPADRARLTSVIRGAIAAPAPVDVVVTDTAEYERRRDVIGSMVYWPSREGRVVHERAP